MVFDKNVFLSLIFSAVISYGIVIYVITLKKIWIVMVVVPGTDQTVRPSMNTWLTIREKWCPREMTQNVLEVLDPSLSHPRPVLDSSSSRISSTLIRLYLIGTKHLVWAFLECQHHISILVENWPIRHQRISVQHFCYSQWILLGSLLQRFTKR